MKAELALSGAALATALQSLVPTQWSASEYHTNLLAPVGRAVVQMERTGVPVDPDRLRDIDTRMRGAALEHRAALGDWVREHGDGREVNWNSWQQLTQWLHGSPRDEQPGLGLEPSPYCKKGEVPDGEVKTDDRALEWIAGHSELHRAAIGHLRQLRQCERMGRYARDWLAAGIAHPDGTFRLHPSFGLASDHDTRPGAITGRFGVKNPALNQVPRNPAKDPAGMRSAFVAPPGCRLIVVDYSQLEIVILAHLIATLFDDSDPLVQAVRADVDIHAMGARKIYGDIAGNAVIAGVTDLKLFKRDPELALVRDITKSGIYGNNYGKGEVGFATSVFLPNGEPLGRERARQLVLGMREAFPGIAAYQAFVRWWIEKYRYIMTPFGRWHPLPHAGHHKVGMRNRAWRQALNQPMQGGGQEIMALALIRILADSVLKSLGFELCLVVHDEIVGWAPEGNAEEALHRVEDHMVNAVRLLCPLKAKGHTGATWAEAK